MSCAQADWVSVLTVALDAYEQQAHDHGQKGKPVKEEAPRRPHGGQQDAAKSRPDNAGGIEGEGVERNGVGQIPRPTISTTKAWRAGPSKAFTAPSSAASTITCQTCTAPVKVSPARTKASTMEAICVQVMIRLRETRSTITPAQGAISSAGIAAANPTIPSMASDLLRS